MDRPSEAVRDVYANLLRDSRGLRRDQSSARDAWFSHLAEERKEDTLFELEMLLKGLACFANVRNHPGERRESLDVNDELHYETQVVRATVEHCTALVRQLLGPRDRAYTFSRYLESVLPADAERTRLIKDQLSQDTPEDSLFVLRNSFSDFLDLCDGLLRLGRVNHRAFEALMACVSREIGRSTYFNPLVALEFRPEFDRIRHPAVLETLNRIENDAAHRVAALTFLALFRCLRYVQLVEQYALNPEATLRSYVILAVLRSDVRSLSVYLGQHAAEVLTAGLEREILHVPASEICKRYERLAASATWMVSLRGALESVASTLRVEVRRVFERELLSPRKGLREEEVSPQLVVTAAQLKSSLYHAIRMLTRELNPDLPAPELASGPDARRQASERLRRDVWMFSQILRAFLAKAEAASGDPDRWGGHASFQFVREFLSHFRAIGYQLVRVSDYQRLDRFMSVLDALRDVDLLDPDHLRDAIEECSSFYGYLEELFSKVSSRAELSKVPFDKRAAADMLRMYLGAA